MVFRQTRKTKTGVTRASKGGIPLRTNAPTHNALQTTRDPKRKDHAHARIAFQYTNKEDASTRDAIISP